MLMAFLKNLSYNKDVSIVDLFGQNPIWLSSILFSINLLFNKIANILYAIFNNVIGL